MFVYSSLDSQARKKYLIEEFSQSAEDYMRFRILSSLHLDSLILSYSIADIYPLVRKLFTAAFAEIDDDLTSFFSSSQSYEVFRNQYHGSEVKNRVNELFEKYNYEELASQYELASRKLEELEKTITETHSLFVGYTENMDGNENSFPTYTLDQSTVNERSRRQAMSMRPIAMKKMRILRYKLFFALYSSDVPSTELVMDDSVSEVGTGSNQDWFKNAIDLKFENDFKYALEGAYLKGLAQQTLPDIVRWLHWEGLTDQQRKAILDIRLFEFMTLEECEMLIKYGCDFGKTSEQMLYPDFSVLMCYIERLVWKDISGIPVGEILETLFCIIAEKPQLIVYENPNDTSRKTALHCAVNGMKRCSIMDCVA